MSRSRTPAVLIALAVAIAGDARAGSTTIDFDALAGSAGTVVTAASFTSQGYTVHVNDVLVIGPGDPGYSGAIGLLPLPDQFSIIIDPAAYQAVDSVSATFAAGSSPAVNWYGVTDIDETGPQWTWAGAPGTYTTVLGPTQAIDRIWLEANLINGSQITSATIDAASPPAIAEPASALLLGLGGLLSVLARAGPPPRNEKAPGRGSGDGGPPAHEASTGDGSINDSGIYYTPRSEPLKWVKGPR